MTLKYVKINASPAEKVARWNSCQFLLSRIYESEITTDDLEKIAVKASEENSKIKITVS